jgi:outer membrane receptor for ferrienterochelin and colicins
MSRILRVFAVVVSVSACAAAASAQDAPTPDVATLSLEDLLGAELVSTASKFAQEVREAPASITVVTAEEIRRQGHRTLADTLRSVRGFYTTYDRNYHYLGVRGFARPGDYNTRVLILLNGHRLNDAIYDMAPIGTDFPVDLSLIQRVEIIRGPGSSLYGTNALFAVINVITKTGAEHKGLTLESGGGSLDTGRASASFGHLFGNERELLIAGSTYRTAGQSRLYFPEFDNGTAGSGVALDLDADEASNVFGSFSAGRFSIHAGAATRNKQLPTAPFGTLFSDDRAETTDERAYVAGVFSGPVGGGWNATARVGYNYYSYDGVYPYDFGDEFGVVPWIDTADAHTVSGELTATRRFARAHLVTAGAEVRRQVRNQQTAGDIFGMGVDVDVPGTNTGLYVQDEVRLFSWLLGNVGVRLDHDPSFGFYATPRAGLVFLPRQQTAIKVLHGRAFRAPNGYENYYYFDTTREIAGTLQPERVSSTEFVWEERLSRHVRAALGVFSYAARHLIEQRSLVAGDGADDLYFVNGGGMHADGIEGEVEAKLPNGVTALVSHSVVDAEDHATALPLSNSPQHLSKASAQLPLSSGFFLGVEGQYVGERRTIVGETLDSFFVSNVTVTSPDTRRVQLAVGVYNVFDEAYGDPGAAEHLQRAIPQDGRTFLARIRVGF